jgi:putative glutamine amidotransferase
VNSPPLIAIPARFSGSASALRYEAIVTARALSAAVLRAGGEPLTVHPRTPTGQDEIADRLAFADGILLPGGGDLSPASYGQPTLSSAVYDVDAEQDAFDLAVARWALDAGVPLLAICRGLQVVNVTLGGSLIQHMPGPTGHMHLRHRITAEGLLAAAVGRSELDVSCFHHQCLDRPGDGLIVTARAADGTPEAVQRPGGAGWFMGVQWHPEDLAVTDEPNQRIFTALVTAAQADTTIGSTVGNVRR